MNYTSFSKRYSYLLEKIDNNIWTSDSYYREYHKRRFYYYLQRLPKDKNIKILDIGSSIFTLLLKNTGYANVTSIDLTTDWKDILEKEDICFYKLDILKEDNTDLYEKFDLILFNETLEHLYMPFGKIFDKLSKYLKDTGSIVIGTPNFSSLDKRIKVLFGFNSTPLFIEDSMEQYHVREYTIGELKRLFVKYGYTVNEYSYPLYFDYPNKTNSISLFIYRLLLFPFKILVPSFRKAIYIKVSKK